MSDARTLQPQAGVLAAAGSPVAPRRPRTVTVVGAGAGNLKATVALNLAASIAALGARVALREHAGASAAALGAAAPARVVLPHAPGDAARPSLALLGASDEPAFDDVGVTIVDPPARLDEITLAAIAGADLVVVPVDASPLALRVLRDVADALRASAGRDEAAAPRLRVTLARLLPRAADRWALVDRVTELAPDALFHATIPMARPRAPRRDAVAHALLYAPGTRAAAAYRALAEELLDALARLPGDR